MVRDYLLEIGEDSVYNVWKAVLQQLENKPYLKPSYTNIRILFYILRKLRLVRFVATEPASRKGYYPKRLYSVVKTKINSPFWLDPYEAYYRPRAFKKRIHLKRL
jgi:hypothetical protein